MNEKVFPGTRLLRRPATWLVAILCLGLAAAFAQAAEQLYTCGMHPQIIKKEPGDCPICGMKLTPIRGGGAKTSPAGERTIKYYKSTMIPGEVKPGPGKDSMGMDMVPVYEDDASAGVSSIQIDAATVQRMNLRTAQVEQGPVSREFRTVGTVAYDEEGLRDVTTKYEGWIEKLHVNTTWASVQAGEPLFDIYSPDLYNAQLNLATAVRSEGDKGGPLTRSALARLRLFDVSGAFIDAILAGGEPSRTYTYRAAGDGVVIEKMAVEGQMMKPGERIYRLADLRTVWVEAQIYEKDFPFVHVGQSATVQTSYGTERTLDGTIALLLPQVEAQARTATARIVLPNTDGFLKPGMFVQVTLAAEIARDAVLVPDMAVLRSGERNTVFVALDGGFFEPREVRLGARSSGNLYQVLEGLEAGERVVTSGQFMLDSESQLREAIQKMLRDDTASTRTTAAAPTTAAQPMAMPAAVGHVDEATLAPLAFATADAAAALAEDDISGYRTRLPAIRSGIETWFAGNPHAAHGALGAYQKGLPEPRDLGDARKAFEPFSSAVADTVRGHGLVRRLGLHVFECPMAPVTGTARWLQRSTDTRNPFFGSKMQRCGDELPADPAPAVQPTAPHGMVLPPGHPPLDATTMASFASRARSREPQPASSCGSCGMSKAAMAAGEPCEHKAP